MSIAKEKLKIFKDVLVAIASSILCIGAGAKLICNICALPKLMDELSERKSSGEYNIKGMDRFTKIVKGIFV